MKFFFENINIIIQIILYIFICFSIYLVLNKRKNIFEKLLLNLIFLMIGTILALFELYIYVVLRIKNIIYLRNSIILSLIFISLIIVLIICNMYFIWIEMNNLKFSNFKLGKYIYNNRFMIFIFTILIIVSIVISAYGFIYYIINNFPTNIVVDLKGNFMDKGNYKRFGECVYFSAVTFFTVGYGDIIPKGMFCCSIVILEMFTSYILTIISVPILLSIMIDGIKNIKQK